MLHKPRGSCINSCPSCAQTTITIKLRDQIFNFLTACFALQWLKESIAYVLCFGFKCCYSNGCLLKIGYCETVTVSVIDQFKAILTWKSDIQSPQLFHYALSHYRKISGLYSRPFLLFLPVSRPEEVFCFRLVFCFVFVFLFTVLLVSSASCSSEHNSRFLPLQNNLES